MSKHVGSSESDSALRSSTKLPRDAEAGRDSSTLDATASAWVRSDRTQSKIAAATAARGVLTLQRSIGNEAVVQLLRKQGEAVCAPAARRSASPPVATLYVQRQLHNLGKVSEGAGEVVTEVKEDDVPKPIAQNEFGLIDGGMTSGVVPHAMSNKGATLKDLWHHAGGARGWTGNQGTGSIQLTAPQFETAPMSSTPNIIKAWIRSGTGKAKVTRSYTSGNSGDNGVYKHGGGQVWITRRAARRLDKHEKAHVRKTKELHDNHIKPLEKKVSKYRGLLHSVKLGTTAPAATRSLEAELDWNNAVNTFSTQDSHWNNPMNQVDTDDMATADFYRDYGQKRVKGTDYDHYIDIPPGPR